jgi:NADPH2:quinone reductase
MGLDPPFPPEASWCAEFCLVDARVVARKPAQLSFDEAGAAPLVSLTAYNALVERANLQAGERVLIHGGAGGVGHVAIQLARWLGAEVYATAGRDRSLAFCQRLGAHACFDHRSSELFPQLARALGPRGVDVVIDTVGGKTLARSAQLLAPCGRLVCLVPSDFQGAGPAPFLRSISLFYEMMGTRLTFGRSPERLGHALQRVTALLAEGLLRVHVAQRFALRDLAAAHEQLARGGFEGKLGVDCAAPPV